MYDIAIIGLGPAGATLARLLSSKFSVIALDKKSETEGEGFTKACGGLLAPDAQKAIAKFGLTLPLSVLVDPQIFSVRTIDTKTGSIRHYQRHYMNMDRDKFDRWLISLIRENVKIVRNVSRLEIFRDEQTFRLNYNSGDEKETVRARFVVGADGANSLVRRTFYKNFKIRTYLAIQEWFEDEHSSPFYSSIFDPRITDCYAWGLSKDKSFILGGAFEVKNGREKFDELKRILANFGFSLKNPKKVEACLVLRPQNLNSFCVGSDNVFLAGEAAGFISPSSLEGISYALESARVLAEVFNENDKDLNLKYARATASIRRKLFLKNLKTPFMYQPFLRKLVMKSGIASMDVFESNES